MTSRASAFHQRTLTVIKEQRRNKGATILLPRTLTLSRAISAPNFARPTWLIMTVNRSRCKQHFFLQRFFPNDHNNITFSNFHLQFHNLISIFPKHFKHKISLIGYEKPNIISRLQIKLLFLYLRIYFKRWSALTCSIGVRFFKINGYLILFQWDLTQCRC